MIRPLRAALGVLACLIAAVAASPARAAELTVSNTADSGPGSLRAALLTATGNGESDTVTISATGSVALGSRLPSLGGGPLTIVGPGASQFAIDRAPAAPAFRIITVDSGATAEISGVTITGGLAADTLPDTFTGGGIQNSGTLALRRVAVVGNTARTTNIAAESTGGGITNSNGGTLTIENSLIAGNVAEHPAGIGEGGGIVHFGEQLTIRNSTITDNAANAAGDFSFAAGGGVYAVHDTTLEAVTLAGNSISAPPPASGQGANLAVDGIEPITAVNTLIAQPTGGGSCSFTAGGSLTSLGHNLEDATSCNLSEATDLPETPAGLGALADNGGSTRTLALQPDSLAIDSGVSVGLTDDQRGEPRPVDQGHLANAPGGDGADIGAFELADTTAPQTVITKKPKRKVRLKRGKKRAKARFRFESEPGATFECSLDEKRFKACSSPLRKKVRVGKHVLRVRATDAVGNVEDPPARAKWRVKRRNEG